MSYPLVPKFGWRICAYCGDPYPKRWQVQYTCGAGRCQQKRLRIRFRERTNEGLRTYSRRNAKERKCASESSQSPANPAEDESTK